jgi:hypothetical protein
MKRFKTACKISREGNETVNAPIRTMQVGATIEG